MKYTPYQWLTFFYLYSILGWMFESVYVSVRQKKLVNRGFLKGTFLPIYGSGAVMMLFVSEPFKENLILTYFAGVFGATLLELITGVALEAIFKVRYWDYSYQKFNYKGYICLSSSVAWGFFTIGMNEWLHPVIMNMLNKIPGPLTLLFVSFVTVVLCVDIVISVREALDLRDVLIRMEEMRKEMLLLRRRADVIIACLDDSWHEFVEEHPGLERIEEVYKEIDLRIDKLKNLKNILISSEKLTEDQKKEFLDFKVMFHKVKEMQTNYQGHNLKVFGQRISGNPTMISEKYRFSLEALKKRIWEEEPEKKPRQEH